MANPKGTGGTHELRERYADMIVKLYRAKTLIRNLFSRDYEGSPKAGSVKIPVRNGEVLVQDYNISTGVALSTSATEYLDVLISEEKAVNELIDGYEAAAVPDNLVAQRMDSAGYSVSLEYEQSAIDALMEGTPETSLIAVTSSTAYTSIKDSVKELVKLGIQIAEVKVIISADTWGVLLEDSRFADTAGNLGAELIRSGVIGKIAGADVHMSTLLPDDVEFVVFGTPWAQSIDEWAVTPSVQDIKDGVHIGASALQGRMVYRDILTVSTAARIKYIGIALVSSTPVNGATGVLVDLASITLTFDEAVEAGDAGNLYIKKDSDDTVLSTFAFGASTVTYSGAVMTIDRSGESDFANELEVYVAMDAGFAVSTEERAPVAAIVKDTVNFTTAALL